MGAETGGSCPACCPVQRGRVQHLTAGAAPPGQGQDGRTRLGRFGSAAGQGPRVPPGGSSLTPAAFLPPSDGISATGLCGAANPAASEPGGQGCSGNGTSDRARKSQTHPGSGRGKENVSTLPAPAIGHPAAAAGPWPSAGLCLGQAAATNLPRVLERAARPRVCIARLPPNKGGSGRTAWLPASAQRAQRLRARLRRLAVCRGGIGMETTGQGPWGTGWAGAGRDGAGRGGAGRQQRHRPHPDGKLGV